MLYYVTRESVNLSRRTKLILQNSYLAVFRDGKNSIKKFPDLDRDPDQRRNRTVCFESDSPPFKEITETSTKLFDKIFRIAPTPQHLAIIRFKNSCIRLVIRTTAKI